VEVRSWKSRGDGRFGFGEIGSLDACKRLAGHEVHTAFPADSAFRTAISNKTVALHDIDGDGFADIVYAHKDGIDVLTHGRTDSGLDGFDRFFTHSQIFRIPASDLQQCWLDPFDPNRIALLFADVDATGVDDLVIVARKGACVVRFTGGQRPVSAMARDYAGHCG
jgi:hypothetical protein